MAQAPGDPDTPFTVLIIDGRATSRAGLRLVLETEPGVHLVCEARTLSDALAFSGRHTPHIIILDLDLVGGDAPAAIGRLNARFPACTLILMALFVDRTTHKELISAGAAACVEKDLPGNFLQAFRNVRQGSSLSS